MRYDLIVCIRCHKYPDLVLDTANSVWSYTDRRFTRVVFAVDSNPRLAARLLLDYPGAVWDAPQRWGWGAGLYGMLCESILWAEEQWSFGHFLSIDYDSLFIAPQADEAMLSLVCLPEIGLVGEYSPVNAHWAMIYKRQKEELEKRLRHIPQSYTPGEGVQGGAMLLTRTFIDVLKKSGYLGGEVKNLASFSSIADDHILPLLCRVCGLSISDSRGVTHCEWRATCDPRGLEKKGYKIIHPTKLRPSSAGARVEIDIRNYFRQLRNQPPLSYRGT